MELIGDPWPGHTLESGAWRNQASGRRALMLMEWEMSGCVSSSALGLSHLPVRVSTSPKDKHIFPFSEMTQSMLRKELASFSLYICNQWKSRHHKSSSSP